MQTKMTNQVATKTALHSWPELCAVSWVEELEAALRHIYRAKVYGTERVSPASKHFTAEAESLLLGVLNTERSRSSTDQDDGRRDDAPPRQ